MTDAVKGVVMIDAVKLLKYQLKDKSQITSHPQSYCMMRKCGLFTRHHQ